MKFDIPNSGIEGKKNVDELQYSSLEYLLYFCLEITEVLLLLLIKVVQNIHFLWLHLSWFTVYRETKGSLTMSDRFP